MSYESRFSTRIGTRPRRLTHSPMRRWSHCSGLFRVALLCTMVGLAACSGPGFLARTRAPLRVGVSPDYPPVVFEQYGEIVGIEADLARNLSDSLGRRIEFARYPFPELLDALERGEIDVVMSGLSITPERAARVRFTEPYMELGQLALIRSRDIARFGRIQTIRRAGARVGYQRGTTGERYVAEGLPRSTSFAFESVEEGLRNLRAGRIDFFVHDAPTVWRIAGDVAQRDLHGLYKPLTQEQIAWAVRPGNDDLRKQLDAAILQWKQEGTIEPIVQRWIPVRVTLR